MTSPIDDKIANQAKGALSYFFSKEEFTDRDLARAKIAASTLAIQAKERQSQSARDALNFVIARTLARSDEELAEYVRLTQPHSPLAKALPAPDEKAS